MAPQMTYNIPAQLSKDIFRAYDIRGVVDEALTEDMVFAIGLAIGSEVKVRGEQQILVARDGRLSGPRLLQALIAGLLTSGRDVLDIGMVPTPLLYFATNVLSANSGVMLTGSHNPANYNGLKIVIAGETLAEKEIQGLYQRIVKQDFSYGEGELQQASILDNYVDVIKNDIVLNRRLNVVIDCGSGVTSVIAKRLYEALGCEVMPLYCDVDGNFPHHHPDPSVADNLQDLVKAVLANEADVGLAFDGDGDRLGVVTNRGQIIWPDRQMMAYAKNVLQENPGAQIIFDVKCSSHLSDVIIEQGGQALMWKTGHSLIKNKLKETHASLAGEMSGHIFFNDRWYGFDDGLYTGARLLEILSNQDDNCHEFFKQLPDSINTPELKLPISEEKKFLFMEQFQAQADFPDAQITTIDGLRVDFADGWGLLRPSNTTPCLVLRFEADNEKALQRIQQQFREQLLAIDTKLILPF